MKIKEIVKVSQNLNVLYVEDNEEARMQTLKMLKNFFDYVDTAVDGLNGLEKFKSYRDKTGNFYDLVITDVNMPNMDGITMSKQITEIDNRQQIIIISAFNDEQKYDESTQAGVQHYIHKPIELTAFISTIEKVTDALQPAAV